MRGGLPMSAAPTKTVTLHAVDRRRARSEVDWRPCGGEREAGERTEGSKPEAPLFSGLTFGLLVEDSFFETLQCLFVDSDLAARARVDTIKDFVVVKLESISTIGTKPKF
jgi:hypothetical protein